MNAHVLDSIDPVLLGARLSEFRKARGLTQQQVAEILGVARTTVTAIEKGERRPRPSELVALANLYGRPVGDFTRQPSPVRTDDFVVHFRTARGAVKADEDERVDADVRAFQQLCEDYVALEHLTEAPLPRRYPDVYDIREAEPEQAAAEVATSERNRLGLGDGPIGDVWGLLEADVGLRIFAAHFASRRLAGLFVFSEVLGGCIAVNGNHPEERRRWTVAHEYAHFLTDRYRAEVTVLPAYRRVPESERFADAFARCFLMPPSGLIRRFQALKRAKDGPVTPADILVLSDLYCVSFQALVLWLEELKLLPIGTWDRLRDAGFKPKAARELIDLPSSEAALPPLPLRYQALAIQAFVSDKLSEGQLARFLRTDRVGARRLVRELTEGEPYYEAGAWRQTPLDFGAALTRT